MHPSNGIRAAVVLSGRQNERVQITVEMYLLAQPPGGTQWWVFGLLSPGNEATEA